MAARPFIMFRLKSRGTADGPVIALLAAALVVSAMLLAQGYLAARSQRRVSENTLREYAAFASERFVGALNAEFRLIFLEAMYQTPEIDWSSDSPVAPPLRGMPPGAAMFHFRLKLDGNELRTTDVDASELSLHWIGTALADHARDVYLSPAPYAVLTPTLGGTAVAVAYRRIPLVEDESALAAYGVVIDLAKMEPVYSRTMSQTTLLPVSADVDDVLDLLNVRLQVPGGPTVFRAGRAFEDTILGRPVSAARAARLIARTSLSRPDAEALLIGPPSASGGVLLGLFLVTAVLILVAVAQVLRAGELTRMREEFVANVSHELRTPLAQIRMFVETLQLGRYRTEEERQRSVAIIDQESQRLAIVVENVLSLTRSRHQRPRLRSVRTDLKALLDSVIEGFTPLIRTGRSRIEGSIAGEPQGRVDAEAVRRILVNLVDNALKYGPPTQVVRVAMLNEGGTLRMSVDDHGPGVPKDEREAVWERFYRGGSGTGTGIGLAVVRSLVKAHRGRSWIEESPSGGARFVAEVATDGVS